jgi:hypothetical protein
VACSPEAPPKDISLAGATRPGQQADQRVQHQSATTRPHLTDRIQPLPASTKGLKTFSDRTAAAVYRQARRKPCVLCPCQNGRKTAVASGQSRTLRTASDLGMGWLTRCVKHTSKPLHPRGDGRHGVKRAHLQARHPVRGRAAGWGTTSFCPDLRVAICDYAGRAPGWGALFSGQQRVNPAPARSSPALASSGLPN